MTHPYDYVEYPEGGYTKPPHWKIHQFGFDWYLCFIITKIHFSLLLFLFFLQWINTAASYKNLVLLCKPKFRLYFHMVFFWNHNWKEWIYFKVKSCWDNYINEEKNVTSNHFSSCLPIAFLFEMIEMNFIMEYNLVYQWKWIIYKAYLWLAHLFQM